MSSFRRQGFVKTFGDSTGTGSSSSTILLPGKTKNRSKLQKRKIERGDCEPESQGNVPFSISIQNGTEVAKIVVIALVLLSLCTGLSMVLGLEMFASQVMFKEAETSGSAVTSTCTEEQPLVWGKEKILDADTFGATRHCLTNHPMLHEKYKAYGLGTHGFAIHFLKDGVERFMSENRYNCGEFNPLIPFFQAARHADANGFVLRVFACDQSWSTNAVCLDTHLDENVYHNKVSTRIV